MERRNIIIGAAPLIVSRRTGVSVEKVQILLDGGAIKEERKLVQEAANVFYSLGKAPRSQRALEYKDSSDAQRTQELWELSGELAKNPSAQRYNSR